MQKILLFLLLLTMATGIVYGSPKSKPVKPTPASPAAEELVALLPQSDYVVLMDAQQIINKVYAELNANQKETKTNIRISKMLSDIEASATKYGVDIHQFNQIAIAGKLENNNDYCVVASGKFNPDITVAAIMANSPSGNASLETEIYQNTNLYVEKGGTTSDKLDGVAFLGTDIMIAGNIGMVKKALDVRAGKYPGLLTNVEMNNYYSPLNGSAAFRYVVFLPEMKTPESANESADKKDLGLHPSPGERAAKCFVF